MRNISSSKMTETIELPILSNYQKIIIIGLLFHKVSTLFILQFLNIWDKSRIEMTLTVFIVVIFKFTYLHLLLMWGN